MKGKIFDPVLKTYRGIKKTLPGLLALGLLWSCSHAPDPVPKEELFINKRNIGEAYIMNGNFTSALMELLEAEKLNPKDAITQNYLGIAYKNKDMPDLAIACFKKAIDINPGYSQARNNLGATYLAKENWDAAITTSKEVIEDVLYTTPQYPLANLGKAYFGKRDYPLAETYFKKALEKQPNLLIALDGLAQTQKALGRYAEAAETYNKAVSFDPKNPLLHLNLAKVYEAKAEYGRAIEEYQRAMDLSPDTELGKEAATGLKRLSGSR